MTFLYRSHVSKKVMRQFPFKTDLFIENKFGPKFQDMAALFFFLLSNSLKFWYTSSSLIVINLDQLSLLKGSVSRWPIVLMGFRQTYFTHFFSTSIDFVTGFCFKKVKKTWSKGSTFNSFSRAKNLYSYFKNVLKVYLKSIIF